MDKTTEKLNFNIVESGYEKYYPNFNKINAAGEILLLNKLAIKNA